MIDWREKGRALLDEFDLCVRAKPRHNAVDVPALLPDGTPAPNSISATLQARGDILETSQFELGEVDKTIKEEK